MMRHQYGYRGFGFHPLFWILLGFIFVPGFRRAIGSVIRTILHTFASLFNGGY